MALVWFVQAAILGVTRKTMVSRLRAFRWMVAAVLGILHFLGSSQAATHTITFQNRSFTPSTLTINAGDTVVFQNAGGTHTVTGYGADPFCGSDPVPSSCSVTFNNPGVFPFRCVFHSSEVPQPGEMAGQITVQGGGGGGGKPNLVSFRLNGWTNPIVVSREPGDNISDPDFFDDQDLWLDWAIANLSETDISPRFFTELLIDGQLNNSWFHDGLAANTFNKIEDFNLGKLPAGEHVFTLVTDHTGVVDESDETDNTYEVNVRVIPSFANKHTVLVANFQFNPATLTIRKGDTVDFRVIEGSHTATGTGADPFCGDNAIPQVCSVTFNNTGTFPYRCRFHSSGTPPQGMTAQIRVIDEVVVEKASKVNGPYSRATDAKVNYENQTVTLTAPATATFWRLNSTTSFRIRQAEVKSSNVTFKFE